MLNIVRCKPRLQDSNTRSYEDEVIGNVDHTVTYDIDVSGPGADSEWIRLNAPIPRKGDSFAFYSNLRATGKVTIRKVGPYSFEADVEYNARDEEFNPNIEKPTPRKRGSLEIVFSSQDSDEAIDNDANGNAIATAMGTQFDPPITTTVSDLVITVSRDVSNFNVMRSANARNKLNSTMWYGVPPGMAKIVAFDGTYHVNFDDPQDLFWRQSVRIIVRGSNNYQEDAKVWWKRIKAVDFLIAGPKATDAQKAAGFGVNDDGRIVYRAAQEPYLDYKLYTEMANSPSPEAAAKIDIPRTTVPVLHNKENGLIIRDPNEAQWYEIPVNSTTDFNSLPILQGS